MRQNGGQSLFELVVAIGVVSLILLTLVSLATLSVRNASFSRNEAEAARLGQEVVEWLRRERDTNWDNLVTQSGRALVQCVVDTSWADTRPAPCTSADIVDDIFQREVDFTCLTDCRLNNDSFVDRIEAVISIRWVDGQGAHEVKNSTYFSDLRVQ